MEAELREMPSPQDVAPREFAVADRVLAERRDVKNELGERPSDPVKRRAWDRGVSQIERYRQEHGVKDPSKAFGREAKRVEQARQETRGDGYRRFSESWAVGG